MGGLLGTMLRGMQNAKKGCKVPPHLLFGLITTCEDREVGGMEADAADRVAVVFQCVEAAFCLIVPHCSSSR